MEFTFAGDVGSEPLDGAVEGQTAGAGESQRVVTGIALILQFGIQRETALLQRCIMSGVLNNRRLSAVASVGCWEHNQQLKTIIGNRWRCAASISTPTSSPAR